MVTILASICGAFASLFVIGIFCGGKLFQRVADIDKWIKEKTTEIDRRLVRLEGNPGCEEDEGGITND